MVACAGAASPFFCCCCCYCCWLLLLAPAAAAVVGRMISAWDTYFEVDDYYTYKKPVGHGAYGVVISALDTRDNSKVNR